MTCRTARGPSDGSSWPAASRLDADDTAFDHQGPPAVTSFTFGCPPAEVIRALQDAGSLVAVTVTSPGEAAIAATAGAYPEINNATRPLRAAAAADGDTERMSLWAGQGYRSATEQPAAEIIERLSGR